MDHTKHVKTVSDATDIAAQNKTGVERQKATVIAALKQIVSNAKAMHKEQGDSLDHLEKSIDDIVKGCFEA